MHASQQQINQVALRLALSADAHEPHHHDLRRHIDRRWRLVRSHLAFVVDRLLDVQLLGGSLAAAGLADFTRVRVPPVELVEACNGILRLLVLLEQRLDVLFLVIILLRLDEAL